MRSCRGMGVEKVRKDDTALTFEFLFRFNRVWINSRLLLLLLYIMGYVVGLVNGSQVAKLIWPVTHRT